MTDGHETVVCGAQLVTLSDQLLNVGIVPHLGQQPPRDLGRQHVRDLAQDAAPQLQGVLHHQNLLLGVNVIKFLISSL